MPIVMRLQAFAESQLQGLGPPELVSILAELFVAACVFGPVIAIIVGTSWLARKHTECRSSHLRRRAVR